MGVTKENGKFRARYTFMGERINLGSFDTELKAKRALNKDRKLKEEAYSFMQPMKQDPEEFIPLPVDPNHKVYQSKPSILERIKMTSRNGREWLKKQLDN